MPTSGSVTLDGAELPLGRPEEMIRHGIACIYQHSNMAPAMSVLDECVIRSALGKRPPEIHYAWAPLWQPTAKERADIGKTTADTIKTLSDTKLFHSDALSESGANLLVEMSILPGLEAALKKFGTEAQEEEGGGDDQAREDGN